MGLNTFKINVNRVQVFLTSEFTGKLKANNSKHVCSLSLILHVLEKKRGICGVQTQGRLPDEVRIPSVCRVRNLSLRVFCCNSILDVIIIKIFTSQIFISKC